jgi:hypothetical protein
MHGGFSQVLITFTGGGDDSYNISQIELDTKRLLLRHEKVQVAEIIISC